MKDRNYIPALRYNWLTALYDFLIRYTLPEKEFRDELIRQASPHIGTNVLDFGVGTGTLSILVQKKIPEARVTGIDVDPKVLEIATRKMRKSGVSLELMRYDGTQIPLADGSMDTAISSLVFHHLYLDQKKNAFAEIFRVLRPGGTLHIADWGKPSNSFMRMLAYPFQLFDGLKNTRDNISGRLPQLLEEAGFTQVTITRNYNTVFGTLQLFEARKRAQQDIHFSLN